MTTEEFAKLMGARVVHEFPFPLDGLEGMAMAGAFFQRRMAQLRAEAKVARVSEEPLKKMEVGFKAETFHKLVELAKETKIAPDRMVSEITEHFLRSLPVSGVPARQ